jgi:hypothetical protein
MTITRTEGYKLGVSKEQGALDVFEDFMKHKLNIDAEFVTDKTENWKKGDFKLKNGKYIEVKGQPVDPEKYPVNFVEIGEITNKPYHTEGYKDLGDILSLSSPLSDVKVLDKSTNARYNLGEPYALSVSIASMGNNTTYAYVNQTKEIVYLYTAKTLLNFIREALDKRGIIKGAGKSNEDTLAVLVPNAAAIWKKTNGEWKFIGNGDENVILNWLEAN